MLSFCKEMHKKNVRVSHISELFSKLHFAVHGFPNLGKNVSNAWKNLVFSVKIFPLDHRERGFANAKQRPKKVAQLGTFRLAFSKGWKKSEKEPKTPVFKRFFCVFKVNFCSSVFGISVGWVL